MLRAVIERETHSALNIQVMCNQAQRQIILTNIRAEEQQDINKVQSKILSDVTKRERILYMLRFLIITDLLSLLKVGGHDLSTHL